MFENVTDKKNPPQIEEFDPRGIIRLEDLIQTSIAISLKRIADILAEAWEKEKSSP